MEDDKIKYVKVINDLTKEVGLTTAGVYVMIKSYMNLNTKKCWPSLTTLEKDTGLTKKMISKHIKILEDKGYIKVGKRKEEGKNYYTNEYTFLKDDIHYEVAWKKFLYNPKLTLKEKMAVLGQQQYMLPKNGEGSGITFKTDSERCDILGIGRKQLKAIDKSLIEKGMMEVVEDKVKDKMSGVMVNGKLFHLTEFDQVVLKLLKATNERIDKTEDKVNDIYNNMDQIIEEKVNAKVAEKIKEYFQKHGIHAEDAEFDFPVD